MEVHLLLEYLENSHWIYVFLIFKIEIFKLLFSLNCSGLHFRSCEYANLNYVFISLTPILFQIFALHFGLKILQFKNKKKWLIFILTAK